MVELQARPFSAISFAEREKNLHHSLFFCEDSSSNGSPWVGARSGLKMAQVVVAHARVRKLFSARARLPRRNGSGSSRSRSTRR
jgi:hypothetical protein